MLSDADLAAIVAKTYSLPPTVKAGDNELAMMSTHGGEFVVACPGTTDLNGWIRDFSAWPGWFSVLGPCHAGFGSGGKAIWSLVRPRLPPNKRIYFIGHSLGGAYAQVLAAMYGAENRNPCVVVTFGSPRVRLFPNLIYRSLLRRAARVVLYARNGDPVPHVPFKPWYLHAFNVTRIGTPIPDSNPLYEFFDKSGDTNMGNHNIDLYASDLRALGK